MGCKNLIVKYHEGGERKVNKTVLGRGTWKEIDNKWKKKI